MFLASEYQVRQFFKIFPIFLSTHKDSYILGIHRDLMFGLVAVWAEILDGALLIIQHLVMNKKLGLIRCVIVLSHYIHENA